MGKRTNGETKLKNTELTEMWLDKNKMGEVSINSSPADEKEEMNEANKEESKPVSDGP